MLGRTGWRRPILLHPAGGLALFAALSDDAAAAAPSPWWLVAEVLGTVLAIAALKAIPARLSARRPVPLDGRSVLDPSILFAMLVYGIVALALGGLIGWLTNRILELRAGFTRPDRGTPQPLG